MSLLFCNSNSSKRTFSSNENGILIMLKLWEEKNSDSKIKLWEDKNTDSKRNQWLTCHHCLYYHKNTGDKQCDVSECYYWEKDTYHFLKKYEKIETQEQIWGQEHSF